ncbi:MAG: DUF6503 family protein [Bacteroidota bacterium]
MKTTLFNFFTGLTLILLVSCAEQPKKATPTTVATEESSAEAPVYDTAKPETVLAAIAHAHGGWGDLWKKRDVKFTYRYHNPVLNTTDLSEERYIFRNEASYGHYTQHEINVMPDAEGTVTQCFDGESTQVLVNGEKNEDPQGNAVADFLRKANYFWFVMPYKLNDPGTIATFEGQEEFNGISYDTIKITYDPEITGKEQNDIYVLYVNPETKLIDRFYFSLPFMGVNDPVLIADYSYEAVNGQKIATKRTYLLPDETGTYPEDPVLVQTLSNIQFNNGFTTTNLMTME